MSVLQGLHAAIDAAFAERSAELAARALELDQREATVAQAAEHYTLDSRIAAALMQGQAIERERITTLIDLQLEHLSPRSATTLVLLNLKKLISEPQ